jgi:hypothetical protein
MEKEEKKKKSGNILLWLLLLLLGGVSGYFFNENNNLKQELVDCGERYTIVEEDKSKVEGELEAMIAQYDALSTDNEAIKEELLLEKEKIEKLLKESKEKNWTISKLKKETETLRKIMIGYVHTIDSLNTLNTQLVAEKEEIKGELQSQKQKYNQLEGVKKDLATKVEIGSRLRALDFTATAQRVKSNNVYRETTKASNTNKIKICFVLDKNDIAKPGKKQIYLRIIAPDASELPCETEDCLFNFNGTKGTYALVREINYQNEESEHCFYYDVVTELPAGEYILELYNDQGEIGKTKIALK